jgi:phosphoserine phosphatase
MSDGLRYRSLVLDVDSTLCGVEGIDWLAERRGPEVARQVRELTSRAMEGEIPLERVYGERLATIQPTRDDVEALATVYLETLATGAASVITTLSRSGMRIVLVSGGLRPAIEPLARQLGVELCAVDIRFDARGSYADFEADSPLSTQRGKRAVVEGLSLARPAIAVGDGATDLAMRAAVDTFIAFTGFATRSAVVAAADGAVASYAELLRLITASGDR